MITELRLQNFKAHRDLSVTFIEEREGTIQPRQLTVLVGPNGSGKTSVLQALRVATAYLGSEPPQRVLIGELDPLVLAAKNAPRYEITLGGVVGGTPFRLSADPQHCRWQVGDIKGQRTPHQTAESVPPALRHFTSQLLRLDARAIAATAYSEEDPPRLTDRGEYAASVLAYLKLTSDEQFAAIEADLKKLVPTVVRLRIQPRKVHAQVGGHDALVNGHQVVIDFAGAPETVSEGVSDGTLFVLAMLTALHTAGGSSLILLDDIEHALHPVAQMELVRTLKRLLQEKPELQVVATTHSPYILDELEPSQVLVFFPREDGTVAVRPLSEHPSAKKAIGTLSAGQIWSLDPEEWVAKEPSE